MPSDQTDLCEALTRLPADPRLPCLTLIRRELAALIVSGAEDYVTPRASMNLGHAMGEHLSPWPYIEAIQAPAYEIVNAASSLKLGVPAWIKGDDTLIARSLALFPDYTPCMVGYVILSAGEVCARAEFEVKALMRQPPLGLFPASGSTHTIDDYWPQGVARARHHMRSLLALEECRLNLYPGYGRTDPDEGWKRAEPTAEATRPKGRKPRQ